MRIFIRTISFLLVIIFIIVLQYIRIEIFYKEPNTPFTGNFFYNPYKNFPLHALKANFHAHSRVPFGIKNKQKESARLHELYEKNGYDILSISEYQRLSPNTTASDYIQTYEHDLNLTKSHQLIINAEKVTFFDFFLFSSYNTKQQVIKRLRMKGGLIALAHPALLKGYKVADMKYLKGYDLIEVLSSYKKSTNIWDETLTNGYPAWIIANDDCHGSNDYKKMFNSWTRIGSKGKSKEEIMDALKRGCQYGARNYSLLEMNFLDSCVVLDNEIRIYFRNATDSILFISDNGLIKKKDYNIAMSNYRIEPEDTYVRVEAITGGETICLNPIIRYNGIGLTFNRESPRVNKTMTRLVRSAAFVTSLSILLLILYLNIRIFRVVQFLNRTLRLK